MFMVITMMFIAISGIIFYKLVAWNWKNRKMVHAARAVVEQWPGMTKEDLVKKLQHALDMEPIEER